MDSDSEAIDPLFFIYLISGVGLVSDRLYYLYFRTLQSMEGQQQSLSKFVLGILAASSSFIVTVINLAAALKGVDLGTQVLVLVVSVLGWILFLWIVQQYCIPKRKWKDTRRTVRLGIHLSEISSCLLQITMLDKIPTRYKDLAIQLRNQVVRRLDNALQNSQRIIDQLKDANIYGESLKKIKYDEKATDELLERAKSIMVPVTSQ